MIINDRAIERQSKYGVRGTAYEIVCHSLNGYGRLPVVSPDFAFDCLCRTPILATTPVFFFTPPGFIQFLRSKKALDTQHANYEMISTTRKPKKGLNRDSNPRPVTVHSFQNHEGLTRSDNHTTRPLSQLCNLERNFTRKIWILQL